MRSHKRRDPPPRESSHSEASFESSEEDSEHDVPSTESSNVPSLLNKTYVSWDEFSNDFKQYGKETYQTLVKRTSMSRTARSTRVQNHYTNQQGTAPESELFLDETFPYYLVSYACTRSGRQKSGGYGKRPRQTVRTIGCKARRDGESYFLKVSVHETEHNHRLGRDSYTRLPSNRLQSPVAELATVNMLRKVGLSRKKILKYIWDNTDSDPDIVDIHNLMAKLKRADEAGTTVSDRLTETLDRFCEKDSFAAAHVCID